MVGQPRYLLIIVKTIVKMKAKMLAANYFRNLSEKLFNRRFSSTPAGQGGRRRDWLWSRATTSFTRSTTSTISTTTSTTSTTTTTHTHNYTLAYITQCSLICLTIDGYLACLICSFSMSRSFARFLPRCMKTWVRCHFSLGCQLRVSHNTN